MNPTAALSVTLAGFCYRSEEARSFDSLAEALAWGQARAAALATAGGLRGPMAEACPDGLMWMGQVTDDAGEAVDAEALVWVGIEVAEAQGNVARRG